MKRIFDSPGELCLDSVAYQRWTENSHNDHESRDIGRIVRLAVRRELTKEQRELLALHLDLGLSASDIARMTGENRSTVLRRLNKIQAVLQSKLEYAVELRYPGKSERLLSGGLAPSDAGSATAKQSYGYISARVQSLRQMRGLTADRVSKTTGISKQRLMAIEQNGKLMSVDELFRLAGFFDVSTDYIVYGAGRV